MLHISPPLRFRRPTGGERPSRPAPPPPPPPVVPANVVSASCDGSTACALVFDRPIALSGGPGEDGSVTVDGAIPQAVSLGADGVTLTLYMGSAVWPGAVWAIGAQPPWVATPLANPAGGTFS